MTRTDVIWLVVLVVLTVIAVAAVIGAAISDHRDQDWRE